MLRPKELKAELDKYILNHEESKKIICTTMYNHYLRINSNKNLPKDNLLMIGKSGTGKTYMIDCLSKILNFFYVVQDCTRFTAEGCYGDDIDSALRALYIKIQKSDWELTREEIVELIESSVIVLDEIDKKVIGSNYHNGLGAQQVMLKFLEGSDCTFNTENDNRYSATADLMTINTKNILFIGAGVFDGITKPSKSMGFGSKTENIREIDPEHVVKFGFLPEFVGRFTNITVLDDLTVDDLLNILTKSKENILTKYEDLLAESDVKIKLSNKTLQEIAEKAFKLKNGVRGLNTILNKYLLNIMYELPKGGKCYETSIMG